MIKVFETESTPRVHVQITCDRCGHYQWEDGTEDAIDERALCMSNLYLSGWTFNPRARRYIHHCKDCTAKLLWRKDEVRVYVASDAATAYTRGVEDCIKLIEDTRHQMASNLIAWKSAASSPPSWFEREQLTLLPECVRYLDAVADLLRPLLDSGRTA